MAVVASRNGHSVKIYSRNEDTVRSINENKVNDRYLTDYTLPDNVSAVRTVEEAVEVCLLLSGVNLSIYCLPGLPAAHSLHPCPEDPAVHPGAAVACSDGFGSARHSLLLHEQGTVPGDEPAALGGHGGRIQGRKRRLRFESCSCSCFISLFFFSPALRLFVWPFLRQGDDGSGAYRSRGGFQAALPRRVHPAGHVEPHLPCVHLARHRRRGAGRSA